MHTDHAFFFFFFAHVYRKKLKFKLYLAINITKVTLVWFQCLSSLILKSLKILSNLEKYSFYGRNLKTRKKKNSR